MKRETVAGICVFVFLIAIGVVSRLLSNEFHVWNFASVTSAALFAGYYLRHRAAAMLVPLAVMVLSNLWLPPYATAGGSFSARLLPLVIYGALMLPVLFRGVLRKRLSPLTVGGSALASSLLFFVVTNFAHWLLIARPEQTLLNCFYLAVPFYGWTLAGDLCWSTILFGSYYLAARLGFLPAVDGQKVPVLA